MYKNMRGSVCFFTELHNLLQFLELYISKNIVPDGYKTIMDYNYFLLRLCGACRITIRCAV